MIYDLKLLFYQILFITYWLAKFQVLMKCGSGFIIQSSSLRASDGSFYPIFLRRLGYLLVTTSSYESDFSWSAATPMVEVPVFIIFFSNGLGVKYTKHQLYKLWGKIFRDPMWVRSQFVFPNLPIWLLIWLHFCMLVAPLQRN